MGTLESVVTKAMADPPDVRTILEAARVAREAGKLRIALRAMEQVYTRLAEEPSLRERTALEGECLGRDLALRGASLGALGEWMRAQELGRDQSQNIRRTIRTYATWRPQPRSVGVAKDGLMAGASGAFWVGLGRRGRVIVLKGGITGEGTDAFTRILELSAKEVDWLFIDMEKLSYVGSTGLAVVVKLAERLRRNSGGVSLFGLSSNLKLLVETLGLATFLHPVDQLEVALSLARPAVTGN